MSSLNKIAAGIDGKSAELDKFMDNLASLSQQMVALAAKADGVMESVSSVASEISASDIEGVVTSFKELLMNMNDPDGTIGKLFVDNSVYDSLDALLSDIDILVRKMQENPKKYIRLSVF